MLHLVTWPMCIYLTIGRCIRLYVCMRTHKQTYINKCKQTYVHASTHPHLRTHRQTHRQADTSMHMCINVHKSYIYMFTLRARISAGSTWWSGRKANGKQYRAEVAIGQRCADGYMCIHHYSWLTKLLHPSSQCNTIDAPPCHLTNVHLSSYRSMFPSICVYSHTHTQTNKHT